MRVSGAGGEAQDVSDAPFAIAAAPPPPPPPPPEETATFALAAGADDGHERNDGAMNLGNSALTPGQNRTIGLRFTGVTAPRGATIVAARVRLFVRANATRTIKVQWRAEAADAAAPFAATAGNFTGRALTAAAVADTPAAWVDEAYNDGPEIAALVQEVVSRPGWAAGGALSVFILDDGSGDTRTFAGFEDGLKKPAELVVTWRQAAGGP